MDSSRFDVAVVGAGAAGIVAAFRAAERGRRTILLDKNKHAGIKILMSGGTRCNITQATDNRGIVKAYGPPGKFLHSALAALSVQDTIAMFEAEGVHTKVEETGKIFPVSNKAADVLAGLLARLDRSGATLALSEQLEKLERDADGWRLQTARRVIQTESVVLTTGGQSYPGSGTTGDGYRFAAALGHTIVTPRPALAPLTTTAPWVLDLRGVTLPDVTLTIREQGQSIASRRSSLLFAHFGLTGPAALDVSRVVSGHPQPATLIAEIDLAPDTTEPQLLQSLRSQAAADGKKQLAGILSQTSPRRLVDVAIKLAQIRPDRRAAEWSKDERNRLVHLLKHLPIPLTGTLVFK